MKRFIATIYGLVLLTAFIGGWVFLAYLAATGIAIAYVVVALILVPTVALPLTWASRRLVAKGIPLRNVRLLFAFLATLVFMPAIAPTITAAVPIPAGVFIPFVRTLDVRAILGHFWIFNSISFVVTFVGIYLLSKKILSNQSFKRTPKDGAA